MSLRQRFFSSLSFPVWFPLEFPPLGPCKRSYCLSENNTYTCTLVGVMTPVGVRGDSRSEAAMMAPTAKATDVKNPKTFCSRVRELYILGERGARLRKQRWRRRARVVYSIPVPISISRFRFRAPGGNSSYFSSSSVECNPGMYQFNYPGACFHFGSKSHRKLRCVVGSYLCT